MKKLTILLFFLITIPLMAQDYNNTVVSDTNSTYTNLVDSVAFTGGAELVRGYSSVSVIVFVSHPSYANGLSLQFGSKSDIGSTTINWDRRFLFTVPDSSTDADSIYTVPVVAPYFRLVYTNGATTTTTLRITTSFHDKAQYRVNAKGYQYIVDEDANAGIDSVEANIEELNGMVTELRPSWLLAVTADTDSAKTTTDSLTFTGTTREMFFDFTNGATVSDTLYIDTESGFTNPMKVWGGTFGTVAIRATTKLYWKITAGSTARPFIMWVR